MPIFEVVYEERWTRTFTVEAEDEDEAMEIAADEDPDSGNFEFAENSGVEVREADEDSE